MIRRVRPAASVLAAQCVALAFVVARWVSTQQLTATLAVLWCCGSAIAMIRSRQMHLTSPPSAAACNPVLRALTLCYRPGSKYHDWYWLEEAAFKVLTGRVLEHRAHLTAEDKQYIRGEVMSSQVAQHHGACGQGRAGLTAESLSLAGTLCAWWLAFVTRVARCCDAINPNCEAALRALLLFEENSSKVVDSAAIQHWVASRTREDEPSIFQTATSHWQMNKKAWAPVVERLPADAREPFVALQVALHLAMRSEVVPQPQGRKLLSVSTDELLCAGGDEGASEEGIGAMYRAVRDGFDGNAMRNFTPRISTIVFVLFGASRGALAVTKLAPFLRLV